MAKFYVIYARTIFSRFLEEGGGQRAIALPATPSLITPMLLRIQRGEYSGLAGVCALRAKYSTYFEEVFGRASFERAVLYLALLGEVVGVFNGREHALDGQEGG